MGLVIPPITSEALRLDITERVNLWVGTQVQYDALPIKHEDTLYLVIT